MVLGEAFDTGPPACIPNSKRQMLIHESIYVKPDMRDGAEGAFSTGPPACIPNIVIYIRRCLASQVSCTMYIPVERHNESIIKLFSIYSLLHGIKEGYDPVT
jgi:hypothetical protein